jgi:hypothetical protein
MLFNMRIPIPSDKTEVVFRWFPDLRGHVNGTQNIEFVSYYIPKKPDEIEARMEYAIDFPNKADAMLFKLKWL